MLRIADNLQQIRAQVLIPHWFLFAHRKRENGGVSAEPLLAVGGPDTDAPAHAPGAAPGTQLERGNAVACIVILAKTILGAGAACKSFVVQSLPVTATDFMRSAPGMAALPRAYAMLGLGLATLFMFLVAYLTYFSIQGMVRLATGFVSWAQSHLVCGVKPYAFFHHLQGLYEDRHAHVPRCGASPTRPARRPGAGAFHRAALLRCARTAHRPCCALLRDSPQLQGRTAGVLMVTRYMQGCCWCTRL